jgi:hypothetical protein
MNGTTVIPFPQASAGVSRGIRAWTTVSLLLVTLLALFAGMTAGHQKDEKFAVVIDDDPDWVNIWRHVLTRSGFQVMECLYLL